MTEGGKTGPKRPWKEICTTLGTERGHRVAHAVLEGDTKKLEHEMAQWQMNKAHYRKNYGMEGTGFYVHAFTQGLFKYAELFAAEKKLDPNDTAEKIRQWVADLSKPPPQ